MARGRRYFLAGGVVSLGTWSCRAVQREAPARGRSSRGSASASPPPSARSAANDPLAVPNHLHDAVQWLEQGDHEHALARSAAALEGGLSPDDLSLALLHASVRTLPRHPLGGELHPLWVIAPAWEIGQSDQVSRALLYAVDQLKVAQQRSRGLDTTPEPGEPFSGSSQEATARVIDALDRWQAQPADTALVHLFSAGEVATLRSILTHYACRSLGSIGHGPLHTASIVRVLDRTGWKYGLTPLRGLVDAALREDDKRYLVTWPPNLERAQTLVATDTRGPADPTASRVLTERLRGLDPDSASEVAMQAMLNKTSLATVWDALRLGAAELALREIGRGGIFPGFHSMTGLNGLRWIADDTTSAHTRYVATLQGAALIASNRQWADERSRGRAPSLDIFDLKAVARSQPSPWHTAGEDRMEAVRELLGWREQGGAMTEFVAAARDVALRKTSDTHHFKLPVAAWEEARAAHPEHAARVFAATFAWGNTEADDDREMVLGVG